MWASTHLAPACQAVLLILTGRIRPTIKNVYSKALEELKVMLNYLNDHLKDREFIEGGQISLADIHIASLLHYPICLAVNN